MAGKGAASIAPCKGFVFGNTAEPIQKTSASAHTHAWKLYLRGVKNEDLRPLVARVIFKLHESFQQPVRSALVWPRSAAVLIFADIAIEEPPYEVKESGWGEFEVRCS
jgi:YEATS domain-containing protein 4